MLKSLKSAFLRISFPFSKRKIKIKDPKTPVVILKGISKGKMTSLAMISQTSKNKAPQSAI